jgi:Protein of unknown function (DUF3380).
MSKLLTEADYERAADALGCDVAAIKAVCEVEAPQGGFHDDGTTPRILFEAHHFSRLTSHNYDDTHPHISSATWNRALYKGGMAEHRRMVDAVALNRDAALQSASWGRFQVMGYNHKIAGHDTIQDFVNAAYRSEGAHLDMFVAFCKSEGLDKFLRSREWDKFAARYNGPSYKSNSYDTKLAAAWSKFNAEI